MTGFISKPLRGAIRAIFKKEPQIGASYKDTASSNPFEQYYAVPLEIRDGYVRYDYLKHQEGNTTAQWQGYRYASIAEFNFFFEFDSQPVEEDDYEPF